MRFGIFSDVHANLEALNAVLEAYQGERIDTYICAGDIIGYGANPFECIKKIIGLPEVVIIAGNHDWAVVDLVKTDYFNDYAFEAIVWTRRELSGIFDDFLKSLKLYFRIPDLIAVHGTLEYPEKFHYMIDFATAKNNFGMFSQNVCFVGHTHSPGFFAKGAGGDISFSRGGEFKIMGGAQYIVNVGSVGQPRDYDSRAAYCIFDTETGEIAIKRVPYDKEQARRKIIAAGLPRVLGDRLLTGM